MKPKNDFSYKLKHKCPKLWRKERDHYDCFDKFSITLGFNTWNFLKHSVKIIQYRQVSGP